MHQQRRRTVESAACLTGAGVRFGGEVTLCIGPAATGSGIMLERTDLGESWPLDLAHSCAGPGCSISGEGEAAVHFVEHIMAAFWARGITDCTVSVDGREVPLLDGSVAPLLTLIDEAGVSRSDESIEAIVIDQPLLSSDGERAVCALPGEPSSFTYALRHQHPLIGRQFASFQPASEDFDARLGPARTFITVEEAEQAKEAGLLAAGTEENSIVVYPDHLSEEPEYPDAFARHKLVDLIGDLYLIGRPLVGRFFAFYSGHKHNHQLADEIIKWCEG